MSKAHDGLSSLCSKSSSTSYDGSDQLLTSTGAGTLHALSPTLVSQVDSVRQRSVADNKGPA